MPDVIPTIHGLSNSIQAIGSIGQRLLQLHASAESMGRIIDLHTAILSAQRFADDIQSEYYAMTLRICDLEEEIDRLKAWEHQKQRYLLITPWAGCYVYALKKLYSESEPPHWICEHCFNSGRKSLLHSSNKYNGDRVRLLKCCHCPFENEITATEERRYV